MNTHTYKIGNKVKAIIRSCAPCTIGTVQLQYGNQPYAVLNTVEASLSFAEKTKNGKVADETVLSYAHDTLKEVRLNNVLITDRILPLIYVKNTENNLFTKQEYYTSDLNNQIFLNINADKIYQVFIYNSDGILEKAYGTYESNILEVDRAEEQYSIYYSYEGDKSFLLDKPENIYVTIDLEVVGNENDGTQDMTVHIEKCVLRTNKAMYFNASNSNAVDLIGTVVYTGLDYITIK